ncbi:hypothetical protein HHL22_15660 [Hymenobacter sp. RP-2-7]|uniref:Uncharacterized protein n=1 Tax=Hymenobacter polaris TaxID=2682546 RepID=A0A7Y0FN80_9BACT|nr:hypothetical protein [Hymenobacter polaris]NML66643.1 hypothetical protein [Hymenobacter polaris]
MKKLRFLGAWWALAAAPARAQTAPADIVVVRIYEGNSITAIFRVSIE